jgi:hypothetical protein
MGGTPTAALNDCLEQAVDLCRKMTERAREAEDGARTIAEQARAIERAVSQGGATRHDVHARASAAAQAAEEGLRAHAAPAVEELEAAAERAERAVGGLTAALQERTERLPAMRGRVVDRLLTGLQRAEAAGESLGQSVDAHRASVETALERAALGLERLLSHHRSMADRIDAGREDVETSLADSMRAALRTAGETAAGVTEALHVLGREVASFANGAVEAHNGAVLALRRTFTGDGDPSAAGPADEWADPSCLAVLPDVSVAAWELETSRAEVAELLGAVEPSLAERRAALSRSVATVSERCGAIVPRHLP